MRRLLPQLPGLQEWPLSSTGRAPRRCGHRELSALVLHIDETAHAPTYTARARYQTPTVLKCTRRRCDTSAQHASSVLVCSFRARTKSRRACQRTDVHDTYSQPICSVLFYQSRTTTHSHPPRPFPSTSWRAGPGACSMRGQPVLLHPFGRPRHSWKAGRDTRECRLPASHHYLSYHRIGFVFSSNSW